MSTKLTLLIIIMFVTFLSYANSQMYQGRNGPLNEREMEMAKIAWKYFENNYQPSTGLTNAVQNYPSTTMWDTGSYLAALLSAYELGIITKAEFDNRMKTIIKTVNELKLFNNELPNKVYQSKTAEKVNYTNQPGEIGFSALDLGRFLIWWYIIKNRFPEYADDMDKCIIRWSWCKVLDSLGMMYGANIDKNKKTIYLQEGRLGYEEYAAKGFQLWGFNTEMASKLEPYNTRLIYDIDIPYDARDPRTLGAHNYVVTESWILDCIELNWDIPQDSTSDDMIFSDKDIAEIAQKIYKVQEERFKRTGIMTARTEHQLESSPYFVYDVIYTDGYPWNTITEDGKYVPEFSSVALKGALGLWVLWETNYTDSLFNYIYPYHDKEKGFYEGIFENGKGKINTFTCNNNGIMLEILLYKAKGKLLKRNFREGFWEKYVKSLTTDNQCIKLRLKK